MKQAEDFAEVVGDDASMRVLRACVQGVGDPGVEVMRRLPESFRRVLGVTGSAEEDLQHGVQLLRDVVAALPSGPRSRLEMAFNFGRQFGDLLWVKRARAYGTKEGVSGDQVRKGIDQDILMLIIKANALSQARPVNVGQQGVETPLVPDPEAVAGTNVVEIAGRTPTPAAVGAAFDVLGVVDAFVPLRHESPVAPGSANFRRNVRKLEVLESAIERRATVRLVAETGNSFLHVRGPFSGCFAKLLHGGGRLEIVLMRPDEHLLGDREELRVKFRQSLDGYKSLAASYKDRIDLRVSRSRLTATMLLTDQESFFEPYVHTATSERERLLLDTFELELTQQSPFHETLHSNFELHFDQAESSARWLRG